MNALVGLVLGIILKLIATSSLYNATPAEGFIVYLIGFISGYLLVKEAQNER
ncbi:F0F1-type ATP synthase assembly protein I [Paenibacillus sp. DS2015]|uniref:hypothetical protein n=1 Tax=Paenibacillus sp. DS2015 TaxID=3373917 RepID=UPI003D24D3F9